MNEKTTTTAQRCMNLYRSAHVINGGWAAVNAAILADAAPDVIVEIKKLPNGGKLAQHIKNLRDGRTKSNAIDPELLPYGGAMADAMASERVEFSENMLRTMREYLDNFQATEEYIDKIRALPFVAQFGEKWLGGVRAALAGHDDLVAKWRLVYQTKRAFDYWNLGSELLARPTDEVTRAKIQADLMEFETYLPMFGDAGAEMLKRLRACLVSLPK